MTAVRNFSSTYFHFMFNQSLPKNKVEVALKAKLYALAPSTYLAEYSEWEANSTRRKDGFVRKIRSSLQSATAARLFDDILIRLENEHIGYSESFDQVIKVVHSASMKTWLELNRALGKAICHLYKEDQSAMQSPANEDALSVYRFLKSKDNSHMMRMTHMVDQTQQNQILMQTLGILQSRISVF
uniref:Uncharacterized protein n=1 Tax=Ditylenchus dipsaci TaxID=166011 RepID=A0A915DGC5_9BILA